jgi:asparagine synthase (glutamine-hydrolysing)
VPGLIGFIGEFEPETAESLLMEMAAALQFNDQDQVDLYHGDGFNAGRVSLGIVIPQPQPIWNEDQTLCVLMEGEIYDYEDLKRYLIDQGHRFKVNNEVEFVLHLYEEFGEAFALKLNGAFALVIWDSKADKLLVVNDRLGLQPLYYTRYKDNFFFASKVGALLADLSLPRAIDLIGMAQLLTFDHVLGDRTLLEGIKLLPPASIMTCQNGHLQIRSYWQLRYPEFYQLHETKHYTEGLLHYLKQAICRQEPGELPSGVLLSGGFDSRVIAAFLQDGGETADLHTFTFGIPGCDDDRFAQEASACLGTRHHFYELRPDYLLDIIDEGIRLQDGLGSCVHMHALAHVDDEAKHAKVIYKGFMGDALMGYGISEQYWANYKDDKLSQVHLKNFRALGLILFNPEELRHLFTNHAYRQISEAVLETFRSALLESGSSRLADQWNYFILRNRVPRMTLNGVELMRSRIHVRLPYCDNDLVNFMLTVPPWLRFKRTLIKTVFIQAFPELAKVPHTETGYPLVSCRRELLMRINAQTRWRLRSAGLKWVTVPQKQGYAYYQGWMRSYLRELVENTLLDSRTLERGYFNPEYIKMLVAEHMNGANHAVRLGALLSIELWHRQYLD